MSSLRPPTLLCTTTCCPLRASAEVEETHVSSVLRKLQLSNRRELARWATDRRLI